MERIFNWACWIFAAYFLYASLFPFMPPANLAENGRYVFLLLAVVFLLVPISQKIEIFKFLSFERKISQMQKMQAAQSDEIKHLQSVQATLLSTVTTISTNTNTSAATVNFYGKENAVAGVADLPPRKETLSMNSSIAEGARDEFTDGVTMKVTPLQELFALSTALRVSLRQALGKKSTVYNQRPTAKYLSRQQLLGEFMERFPDKTQQKSSFDYFFQVADAAHNGQQIPDEDLMTALFVGQHLLRDLNAISAANPTGSVDDES